MAATTVTDAGSVRIITEVIPATDPRAAQLASGSRTPAPARTSFQTQGFQRAHPKVLGVRHGLPGIGDLQGLSCWVQGTSGQVPVPVPSRHCDVGLGWDASHSNGTGIPLPHPSPDHPHLRWNCPHLLRDHPDSVGAQEPFSPCGQRDPLLAWDPGKLG